MGRQRLIGFSRFSVTLCLALFFLGWTSFLSQEVRANDLPFAANSPLVGIGFDDKPLSLPVQRNFQMAMLTASSELGRSCGRMESYGWKMNQSEQQRVDQIFNSTVDRLRSVGYVVESRALSSLSSDVTLFTADRVDRHFLFMWSAGEIGLVMVLCESSAPLGKVTLAPPVTTFPQDVMKSRLETPAQHSKGATAAAKFTPVGDWIGNYTCAQGYTGATLQITLLEGENFQGFFRFYPSPKNPYVASGRYMVYGQYDRDSQRILINPGKWLERPKDYYNTVMVGSFDPIGQTFSAYFQGISGCTSFEAKYAGSGFGSSNKIHKAKKKTKSKTKAASKSHKVLTGRASGAESQTVPTSPQPALVPSTDASIKPSGSAPALVMPTSSTPVIPAATLVQPVPQSQPPSGVAPTPTPTVVAPVSVAPASLPGVGLPSVSSPISSPGSIMMPSLSPQAPAAVPAQLPVPPSSPAAPATTTSPSSAAKPTVVQPTAPVQATAPATTTAPNVLGQ